jgi:hypothetical protein
MIMGSNGCEIDVEVLGITQCVQTNLHVEAEEPNKCVALI